MAMMKKCSFSLFDGCKALKDITPLSNPLRINIVDDRTYQNGTTVNVGFDYMFVNTLLKTLSTPLNHLFDKLDEDDFNYTFKLRLLLLQVPY